MSMFKNPSGWLRAVALGSALLIGAATIAGPAAADELASDSSCLNGASVAFSLIDEQASVGLSQIDEQATIGFEALDEQGNLGFSQLDEQASIGFEQIDAQSLTCAS